MVQPTDVRVGNWVNNGSKPKMITIEDFWGYYVDPMRRFYYYEPIPLTPDILEKAGAERPGKGDQYGGYLIEIANGEKIRITPTTTKCFWYMSKYVEVEVTYLHQLQNLIFSLTGKELIINL